MPIDGISKKLKNKFMQAEAALKKIAGELNSQNSEYEKVFEKIMELESK